MCGVWHTDENGLERCPVSHAQMQAMAHPTDGLTHLWARGTFQRALNIWDRDAEIRLKLTVPVPVQETEGE